ncbi:hypothetical protein [Lactococcus lactis]|uniref:hypothetical protein n=1 Tax=Lactococcus lactis TaxID=1358 RepID=UPI0032E4C1CB
MKLSEIEEIGYLLTAYDEEDVYEDGDINYDVFEFHRDNYTQNDMNKCGLTQWDFCDCQPLYTAEEMQEYAKAKVAEALKACLQIKVPGRCDGKSAMISEQFKNTIDSIFEEDTKND